VHLKQIAHFEQDGYIKLERAVPAHLITQCERLLWDEIGLSPDDPGGWTAPVRWVGNMEQEPFVHAMNCFAVTDACEALAGPGRWKQRRSMGAFPLRFPHPDETGDQGWHVEGSYMPDGKQEGRWWINYRSKGRALLALFLFTEVDSTNGPTMIRAGSHLDVPSVLWPYGEEGVCAPDVSSASAHRPVVLATGAPGDVFICHPFLVHAAQANHGTRPRFMGQPGVLPDSPYRLGQSDKVSSPVARTINRSLDSINN